MMNRKGTNCVGISGLDNKRQITALFACTTAGHFLPIQLIYCGRTPKCLPKVTFPSHWYIMCTPNHWSNEATMIEYVNLIIIPYVTEKRKELALKSNHTALVFDAFNGQWTQEMFQLLQETNIMYVLVPSNCTDKCQPLDLSVNKTFKGLYEG